MLISELFEPSKSYALDWIDDDAPSEVEARAYDVRGREISIRFIALYSPRVVEIDFEVDRQFEVTGQGDQYRVFSTVVEAIRQYISRYQKPDFFIFLGKGISRSSLYQRMVARLASGAGYQQTGWQGLPQQIQAQMPPGGAGRNFVLKRRGADLEEGWREKAAAVATAATLAYGGMHNLDRQPTEPRQQAQIDQPRPQAQPQVQPQTRALNHIITQMVPDAHRVLVQQAKAAGIHGMELAHFVAQMWHETGNWQNLEEQPPRSAQDPSKYFARRYDKAYNPPKAKILGNIKPGDGARYKGRGYIQLTGRYNYDAAGKALGVDLVNNPELAADPATAAKVALWYWQRRVQPRIDDFATATVAQVTKGINPGLRGLQDREAKFQKIANSQR